MSLLIRGARPLPLNGVRLPDLVDLRAEGGVITALDRALTPRPSDEVVEAGGRWLMPGLWDAHVHFGLWARTRSRLDLSGAAGPEEVTRRLAGHLAGTATAPPVTVGYGYRSASWARPGTLGELDAASGGHAVVLVSGDGHNGWVNSRAAALLGIDPPGGPIAEQPWFEVLRRLDQIAPEPDPLTLYRDAQRAAAARGVVGITDFQMEPGHLLWPERVARGADLLRVQSSTYAEDLDGVLGAGLRTGDAVDGELVRQGPLKVIFDGSLNTGTAYCTEAYCTGTGSASHGTLNLAPEELTALLARAAGGGLAVAVHAIGDAAAGFALDAIERAAATGTVEHAQLLHRHDLPRFAALGVTASVQPAHLLDDRDVTHEYWPDRASRCFPLRSLRDHGARLAFGSDAPVAPLDPWLAIAAAAHRSADERPPWNAAEALPVLDAVRCSTGGVAALRPGGVADLVLLDSDPLAGPPEGVAGTVVALTVVGGRPTHRAL